MPDTVTEIQPRENSMLKLAAELREQTHGMCSIGIGPYGYGVHNCELTKVGVVMVMEPNIYGEDPHPAQAEEYTVSLKPIRTDCDSGQYGQPITPEQLHSLCEDHDIITSLVAKAVQELCSTAVTITCQEEDKAYQVLAEIEQHQDSGLTLEEAQGLAELRWYESKTPIEIVRFQLCEKQLCMPEERFAEAMEAVFGVPVGPEDPRLHREEYLEQLRKITVQEAPDVTDHQPEMSIM